MNCISVGTYVPPQGGVGRGKTKKQVGTYLE
jgi:hypothetical protein